MQNGRWLNAQVIGSWKHALTKAAVIIHNHLHKPLSKPVARSLDAAVNHYVRFMGVPAALS